MKSQYQKVQNKSHVNKAIQYQRASNIQVKNTDPLTSKIELKNTDLLSIEYLKLFLFILSIHLNYLLNTYITLSIKTKYIFIYIE